MPIGSFFSFELSVSLPSCGRRFPHGWNAWLCSTKMWLFTPTRYFQERPILLRALTLLRVDSNTYENTRESNTRSSSDCLMLWMLENFHIT